MANYIYDKEVLETFIKNQGQLFDEPVAESLEDADEFLDMMMAVVVDSKREVEDYFIVNIICHTNKLLPFLVE